MPACSPDPATSGLIRTNPSTGEGVALAWPAVGVVSVANPMAREVKPLAPTTGVARTASEVKPLAPTTGVRSTAGEVNPAAAATGVEKTAREVRPLAPTMGDGMTAREVTPLPTATGVGVEAAGWPAAAACSSDDPIANVTSGPKPWSTEDRSILETEGSLEGPPVEEVGTSELPSDPVVMILIPPTGPASRLNGALIGLKLTVLSGRVATEIPAAESAESTAGAVGAWTTATCPLASVVADPTAATSPVSNVTGRPITCPLARVAEESTAAVLPVTDVVGRTTTATCPLGRVVENSTAAGWPFTDMVGRATTTTWPLGRVAEDSTVGAWPFTDVGRAMTTTWPLTRVVEDSTVGAGPFTDVGRATTTTWPLGRVVEDSTAAACPLTDVVGESTTWPLAKVVGSSRIATCSLIDVVERTSISCEAKLALLTWAFKPPATIVALRALRPLTRFETMLFVPDEANEETELAPLPVVIVSDETGDEAEFSLLPTGEPMVPDVLVSSGSPPAGTIELLETPAEAPMTKSVRVRVIPDSWTSFPPNGERETNVGVNPAFPASCEDVSKTLEAAKVPIGTLIFDEYVAVNTEGLTSAVIRESTGNTEGKPKPVKITVALLPMVLVTTGGRTMVIGVSGLEEKPYPGGTPADGPLGNGSVVT